MELYIQVTDNQIIGYPMILENIQIAGYLNMPANFVKFVHTDRPTVSVYEKLNPVQYVLVDNTVIEEWSVSDMTPGEISSKQENIKMMWADTGFASWKFNEIICRFVADVEYPTDGNVYLWDEATLSWALLEVIVPVENSV
jgi:hypothetical protein